MTRLHGSRFSPWLVLMLLSGMLALAVSPMAGSAEGQKVRPQGTIPGHYIVSYRSGVDSAAKTDALASDSRVGRFNVRHVYNTVLNGFAAELSDAQITALRADPDVVSITPDYAVSAFADSLPNGVRRIDGNRSPIAQMGSGLNPVDIDVAIIDTGIDLDHPDLNVAGGVNCVPGETSANDGNGHGTHVAGTVGALDNGSGVIGVAPGARVWAVRVLNAAGEGEFSDVMCGVEWVTDNANIIEVANLSLGGEAPEGDCTDGSLHEAICDSVAAGVTYVVAAGNSNLDAAQFVPASYDEVITVSAITDTDGKPGGLGSTSFFYGADDSLAAFSNYGADVDIAAPGFNIYSTWMNGGYRYENGTSMAAPHVTGAAALYLMTNPGASPAQVRSGLMALGWPRDSSSGFTDDRDPYAEPVLNAGAIGGGPLQPSCVLQVSSIAPGATLGFSCSVFAPSEFVQVYFDSAPSQLRGFVATGPTGSGSGSLIVPDLSYGPHTVIFVGPTSGAQVSQTLSIEPVLKLNNGAAGKVGALAMVQVRGFGAAETVQMRWVPAQGAPVTVRTFSTNAVGVAYSSVTIPEAAAGTYTLQAVGMTTGATSSVAYTVIPSVTLAPSYVRAGQTVTVSLRGYAPGDVVSVRWFTDATTASVVATATASALGSATTSFVVPTSFYGQHTVDGNGTSGATASTVATVQTYMVMTPPNGAAGTPVTLTLTGYRAGEEVVVRWYDTTTAWTQVATATTASDGSATVTFAAPVSVSGIHRVEAISASNLTLSGYFYSKAGMSMNPTSGPAGTSLTVTYHGFRAGETVSARWYTNSYAFVTTASSVASAIGDGTITFSVPTATVGAHKVELLGGTSYTRVYDTFTYTAN